MTSSLPAYRSLVAALGVALLAVGCASSPNVKEAPLADARQKKLRKNLVGTWEHAYVVPEGGEREPAEEPVAKWTFKEDGSGMRHSPGASSTDADRETFRWRLEGRNLVLEFESSGGSRYFRAESWSPRQMRWFNYDGSNVYIVRRSSDPEGRRPNPRERRPVRPSE